MGSAERAHKVLHGAPVALVVDAGKPEAYRTVRVGDTAALEHAMLKEKEPS